MDKSLIVEISRLKSLMGINEQDLSLGDVAQRYTPTKEGERQLDDDYKIVKIGAGTNYPLMLDITLPVVTDPFKEPSIKQFDNQTTFSEFFKEGTKTGTFVEGDKLPNGKPAPVGQQYVILGGNKYCLPNKEWVELHTQKKFVYQFTNQKTNETFGLKLATVQQVLDGETLSGRQISARCPGGSNGWAFTLDPQTKPVTMFYSHKNGEVFDPEKNSDINSDFDDWWEEWKVYVEVGVGLLASMVIGPALAQFFVVLADASLLGTALSEFIIWASQQGFLASHISWVEAVTTMIVEAGLMTPIALEYIEEGDPNSAALAWAFSFAPFILELAPIARFIKSGRLKPQEAEILTKEILEKMKMAGGYKTITQSLGSEYAFYESLSEESKGLWMGMKRLMVENPKVIKQGIELGIKQNSEKILEAGMRSQNKGVLHYVNRWGNVARGKGLIPQLARGFVLIGGGLIGFEVLVAKLKQLGASEKTAKVVAQEFQNKITSSQYWQDISLLNQKFGLGAKLTEQQQMDTLNQLLKDDPDAINKLRNSDFVQNEFFNQDKIDAAGLNEAKQKLPEYSELLTEHVQETLEDPRIIAAMERLNIKSKKESLTEILKQKGYNVDPNSWVTSDKNTWKFKTTNNLDGEIIMDDENKIEIKVGGNTI